MSKKTVTDEPYQQIDRLTKELARLEDLKAQLEGEVDTCRQELERLAGDKKKYREVFLNCPFEAIIVDHEGRVTDVNKRRQDAVGKRREDRFPQIGDRMYTSDFAGNHKIDMRRELMECIQTGLNREFSNLGYRDRYLSVKMAPFAGGAIITAADVTRHVRTERDKKKFESQLLQSQKMEAVGTLAGGIAHDFNNILWIITGNVELVKTEIAADNDRAHYHIQRVEEASRRAKDLVTQILNFSRHTSQEKRPLKISTIVKESLKLLRSSLPTTIEIKQNIAEEEMAILADLTQISQVLVNLCTNAAHAMRESGGMLDISLSMIVLDEDETVRHQNLAPGKYALLSVMDTGKGIPEDVVDRIFDPFFTTKQVDEGTGMGLSVVHGIVKNHDGAITVFSTPGKGAVFHVLLPLIKGDTESVDKENGRAVPTGNERILLVDDDGILLETQERILHRLGYAVVPMQDSNKAFEEFKKKPHKFDLVITDQTMPGMTGLDLARGCITVRPDIRIILCTGFSESVSEEMARSAGVSAFLMKPVVMRKLAHTVRAVLDEGGA
ncbi:MAG: response regulator [Desulfobacterales bacterium]|nr:response regulator [Desulfobacterales bacterium]